MYINQIQVENFRNLGNQLIPFAPKINLVIGENGAGKTSLLEAIYYLGRQRSFRTSKPKELIKKEQSFFRIIAKTTAPAHQIGIERKLDIQKKLSFLVRLDRQTQRNPAELAKIIPVIAITSRSFKIIDAGPLYRREFIDYGTFHLDNAFLSFSQVYNRALKNRNAALKKRMPKALIDSFTPQLADSGQKIHQLRLAYFVALKPLLDHYLSALNFPYAVKLHYQSGWHKEESLLDSLHRHLEQDCRVCHTRYGPHRADIRLTVEEGREVANYLSRGQQKSLILALYLAQINLIGRSAAAPLLIFDDIAAEFDLAHRNAILNYLSQLNCQMFFSTTESELFDEAIRQQSALIRLNNGLVF